MEDLYGILGVPRDATQDDIKKAYRKLVHQFHPDSHPGDKDIEEKFKKINAAYTILSDKDKRAYYDRTGSINPDSGPSGGGFNFDFGDLFDLFGANFGGGNFSSRNESYSWSSMPQRGNDLEMTIDLTLLEAFTGVTRTIDITKAENCQHCNGTGAKPGTKPVTCPKCNGTGRYQQVRQTAFTQFVTVTSCPDCHGTGKVIRDKCDECGGTGRVRKKHKIDVKIPAGIENGKSLRIAGAGEAGINGGQDGNLYLVMRIAPNTNFERSGADLHTTLLITYPQAVLGTEAEIKTLDGKKEKISVAPGTHHGQVLKLKGQGMPKLNAVLNSRGDLYAHVFVEIPKTLTDKQRELITALDAEMKSPNTKNKSGFKSWLKEKLLG